MLNNSQDLPVLDARPRPFSASITRVVYTAGTLPLPAPPYIIYIQSSCSTLSTSHRFIVSLSLTETSLVDAVGSLCKSLQGLLSSDCFFFFFFFFFLAKRN